MRPLLQRYLAEDEASRAFQISGIMRFALLFIQGIVLVKAGVPTPVVGQVELVFFVLNFFQYFWQNGGHQAMLSWKTGEERKAAGLSIFLGMHLQAFIAIALVGAVALLPAGEGYSSVLQGRSLLCVLLFVFFSVPVTAIFYQYLQAGRYRSIILFTAVSQGLQVAVVLWVIFRGGSVGEMLFYLAVFAALRWLYVVLTGGWFVQGKEGKREAWPFVVFAFPLILYALNGGLTDYADGWIVSAFFGDDTFARYRFGARELPLNALLIGGLVSGLIHRFRSVNMIDPEIIRKETMRLMHLVFPLNCILVLLSPLIFTWVYSADFILSARIFNIYVLTLVSRCILNQVYCYVRHDAWVLTWSTLAETLLNIVLSIVLLRSMGILGIPVATAIAYAVQKIFLIGFVHRKYNTPLHLYLPVRHAVLYFALLLGCVLLSEWIYY